jgi:hypothetical protein
LSEGKQIGPWQWEHKCSTGKHILRGDPSQAKLDFDGNAISGVHFDLVRQAVDHGLVYQVTGDVRHARKAREILLAYAERYLSYPMHNNQGALGRGARIASQSLTEASWLIEVLHGADLVWTTLSAGERQMIADKMIRPALNEIILKSKLGIHNIQCRLNSAIGLAGFLLADQTLIARAIDDPAVGYRQQMEKGVLADGMWTEGSSGYHFFTVTGVWPLTEAARNCGLDLYGPKYRSMFEGPLSLAMPNFVLPDFNDSGMVTLAKEADLYELGYARYQSPLCVPLLADSTRRNRMALLFGAIELPKGSLAGTGSRNSTASGYAILQQGQGKEAATWLCVKYGPHGGGHGHPDKNQFILFTRGQILAPDGGTHAYGSPLHSGWDKATFSHNTLTVNETSQKPATGRTLAFGQEKGVDYSITEAGEIYPGVKHIRTTAMLSPRCVLVVDQVQGAKAQTLDIVYHQYGTWDQLSAGTPWVPPATLGYKYVMDATTRDVKDANLVFTTKLRDDWRASITVAATEPTEIITGYGILKTTEDRVPVLIQRRKAQQTTFVWAISTDASPVNLKAAVTGEMVQVGITSAGQTRQVVLASGSGSKPFQVK